jgi:iron complex outermembrane recepter protein
VVDCSGRPSLNSPKWSANFSYDHRFDLGDDLSLTVGASTHLETSSWINLDYLDYQRRDGFMRSNAFAELEQNNWSLTAFVDNIENATVFNGVLTRPIINVTLFAIRPPRTYGFRLAYNF